MSGYSGFARYYDSLMQNVDYAAAAAQIDRLISRFGKKGILLDAACGTGSLSEELALLGYDVIGVDSSCEMLGIAFEKKLRSGLDIQYLLQDMTKLDLFGTIDAAVCALDSLNHLGSEAMAAEFFSKTALFSAPGAVFIFDVNTLHKHRDILSDNAYIYSFEEFYCGWQNEYNESDGSVDIYLDFFETLPGKNEIYVRISEEFREIYLSDKTIRRLLSDAGFEVIGVYDGYSDKPLSSESERAVYAARYTGKNN